MAYGRIYVITNTVNGRQYVGQTTKTIEQRFRRHCACNNAMPIVRAIKKHGAASFTIRALEEIATLEEMGPAELRWAQELNTFAPSGYNLSAGESPRVMSEDVRKRISEAHKGRIGRRGPESSLWKPIDGEAFRAALERNHWSYVRTARELGLNPGVVRAHWSELGCDKEELKRLHRAQSDSRKQYIAISPDGVRHEFRGLAAFCREQGLNAGAMAQVLLRKVPHHKGWRADTPT